MTRPARSTIAPTAEHARFVAHALERVAGHLGDSVESGFATARASADLLALADEREGRAVRCLVEAAYYRDLVARREAARDDAGRVTAEAAFDRTLWSVTPGCNPLRGEPIAPLTT